MAAACRAPLRESQQTIPETPSPVQATMRKTQGGRSRFTHALPTAPAVRPCAACCELLLWHLCVWHQAEGVVCGSIVTDCRVFPLIMPGQIPKWSLKAGQRVSTARALYLHAASSRSIWPI